VATRAAQAVTANGAIFSAAVNPRGKATRYWFQYGTSTHYGHSTAAQVISSGRRVTGVRQQVAGLQPLTTYHFRVVATHCRNCPPGTARGGDASFTVGGYQNPVYGTAEAADPFVLDDGGTHNDYWAFTTGDLFPILRSPDLVHWTRVGNALTARPSWVLQTGDWHPWGPNVLHTGTSCPGTTSPACYVMYYTAVSADTQANCVAVAVSPRPSGPFVDQGPLSDGSLDAEDRPMGCGDDQGYGSIDPALFIDPRDGGLYLYLSEDFACPSGSASCGPSNSVLQPTISVIPLTADGLHAAGARMPLFSGAPGSWEQAGVGVPTVEGPTVMVHNGLYYMLYSGGNWRSTYGMGYAVATSPTGPFDKGPPTPLLFEKGAVLSPGGGDAPVTGPHGGTWLVYHARAGSYANPRTLRIEPLGWTPGANGVDTPVINGLTVTPQPIQP
jgi:beta-xylosidase